MKRKVNGKKLRSIFPHIRTPPGIWNLSINSGLGNFAILWRVSHGMAPPLGPPQGLGHSGQDLGLPAGVRSLVAGVRAPRRG